MFKIKPVFKDYIWGGDKLRTLYGKESDLEIVAESWELSTHKDGVCSIATGPNQGMLLTEYIKQGGKEAVGTKVTSEGELPILIKLIDAKDNLSVQVHPNDEYAKAYENDLGKTEMWVVLEAEEGAKLVYGFKEEMSKAAFENAIKEDRLEEVLNYMSVKKGDVLFIEPGSIHAIGKGIVIAEIQQSSNVTYRVYDYGRLGVDGKPRPLHVEKAIEVTRLNQVNPNQVQYEMVEHEGYAKGKLVECNYFTVEQIELKEEVKLQTDETSFHVLLVTEGEMQAESHHETIVLQKGDCLFIPAYTGEYVVKGKGNMLLSYL